MERYRALFLKTLCDPLGHPHKCVQAVVDIHHARSFDRALKAAQYRFQRHKKIPDWRLYADEVECEHLTPCDCTPPKNFLHF